MSQPARVYRILIAAPPDVGAARELVGKAIVRWNNENFRDRRVVLLPLAWEPQDETLEGIGPSLLHRDVAGGCDLFIGLFWTRLASVPGQDVTELLDAIEAQRRAGVPVLLFFSRQRALLDEVDPHELARLKEFRSAQAKAGGIEEFSDLWQFREMVQRLLDQQIRYLLSAESLLEVNPEGATTRSPVRVDVSLADPSSGVACGENLSLEAKYFEIRNFDQIPDYQRADGSGAPAPSLWGVMYNQANKEYYRDYIKYVFQGSMLRPVRISVQNTGLIGLRDVRIEVAVTPLDGAVFCLRPEDRLVRPDKEIGLSDGLSGGKGIGFPIDRFSTNFELGCLQPQRVLTPPALFLIGADRDVTCYVDLLIYADSLAEPLSRRLTLDLHVTRESVDALEFFEVLRER